MTDQLPPGPRAPRVAQTADWYAFPYAFFERCRRRYGATFTTRLLSMPPTVMLTRPDDVRQMYTAPPEDLHPGEGMRLIEPLVGANSLILLDEAPHLRQRKLLLPAFHGERLRGILAALDDVVESGVAAWPRDRPISIHERARHLTLDVILRAAMGLRPGPRLDAFRHAIARFLELGMRPTASLPATRRNLGPLSAWPRFAEARAELDALIFGFIEERAAGMGADSAPADDVLGLLLTARDEEGAPMSRQELRDELLTLLVAGHETTATALAWTFERLAVNGDARAVLVSRLDRGEAGEYPSAVVHESMRQRPVIAVTGLRLVKQPVEIGGRGYEPGCGMTANAYLLHHDEAIYPEPYAFRPERFLERRPGTYAWIPFGGGIRRCIGAALALAEMEAVLRHVFTRFEVRFARTRPHRPVRRNITVSPRGGVQITLTARRRGGRRRTAMIENA
ncbi:MAG TPA: cytochrome P450 [Solirubrobacterales bacterium]|jgi:cytochrome P450|nr:cytochrome P450 [Solirubrobacterales bacterium]